MFPLRAEFLKREAFNYLKVTRRVSKKLSQGRCKGIKERCMRRGVAKFTTAENKGKGPPRVHRRVSLHNVRWLFITRKDSRQRLPYFLAHPACGIPWFNYLLRVKVPEKSARKFLGGRHQSPPLIIYRHVDYLVITCTHDANVFSSLFLNYHDLALSSPEEKQRRG